LFARDLPGFKRTMLDRGPHVDTRYPEGAQASPVGLFRGTRFFFRRLASAPFAFVAARGSGNRSAFVNARGKETEDDVSEEGAAFRAVHLAAESPEDGEVHSIKHNSHPDADQEGRNQSKPVNGETDECRIHERDGKMRRGQRKNIHGHIPAHNGVHGTRSTPRASSRHDEVERSRGHACRDDAPHADPLPGALFLMFSRLHYWEKTRSLRSSGVGCAHESRVRNLEGLFGAESCSWGGGASFQLAIPGANRYLSQETPSYMTGNNSDCLACRFVADENVPRSRSAVTAP